MRHWPQLIEFLGEDPHGSPNSLGEHLLAYRRHNGLSRKAFAAILMTDENTLWRWETNDRKPASKRHLGAIRKVISIRL
jgi:DNA-binding transcriptional regulator YiaG